MKSIHMIYLIVPTDLKEQYGIIQSKTLKHRVVTYLSNIFLK
jgi:hypothetical protein